MRDVKYKVWDKRKNKFVLLGESDPKWKDQIRGLGKL